MSERIRKLFSEYHGKYDGANHIYSLGIDISWRKEAVKEAMLDKRSFNILDVATGTADVAIMLAEEAMRHGKRVEITGMDFNNEMLKTGREKVARKNLGNISLFKGDALSMDFADSSYDLATCAFALRNFDDLRSFFKELHRVLKKNGKFVILEMGNPDDPVRRAVFQFYFGVLMRPLGYIIGIDAYKWLLHSITHFDKKSAVRMLKEEGFRSVKTRELAMGVGFLITGTK